jgi:thiol-disulfide isomerase/thioredoxin
MQWLNRLAGLLVAPRQSLSSLVHGGRGGVADVLGWMFLVMLGTQPADTAATVLGASRGILPAAARLVQQFVLGYALQPMVVCLAFGLALAGILRVRGRKVPIDGLLAASVYLWVPVGVLAILGALLLEVGWHQALLPHVPLAVFFQLEPAWWEVGLRLALSYGPSLWLAWILFQVAWADPPEPRAAAPRKSWAGWALAGWLLISWAGGTAWAWVHYESIRPVLAGDPAASFQLPRADGKGVIALEQLRGKPVVIEFWAEWCGVCMRHMPELDRWAAAHPEVLVLAVHQGGERQEVQALVERSGWKNLTVVVDERHAASRAYRVDTLPTFFVVDADGKIAAARVGAASDGWLAHALGLEHDH